jgi:hypothetical protein
LNPEPSFVLREPTGKSPNVAPTTLLRSTSSVSAPNLARLFRRMEGGARVDVPSRNGNGAVLSAVPLVQTRFTVNAR